MTRQAKHAKAKRAARGLKPRGRKPWACEKCHKSERWTDNEGKRHCRECRPPARRGRTKQPQSNILLFPEFNRPAFNKARFQEARISQGLSQTDLARKIGVSVETVSNWESGQRSPSPEAFTNLCQALGFPESFFQQESQKGGDLQTAVFFRSFSGRTKKENLRLGIWRAWAGRILSILSRHIELPPITLPQVNWSNVDPAEDSSEKIEALATECRRMWKLGDGPISHLTRLVEAMGVAVIRLNLEGLERVDAFSCWQDGRPLIFLIGKDSACRERMNVGHEILHLIAHRQIPQDELESGGLLERIEQEAKTFASALLLPATTYPRELYSFQMEQFRKLKGRWGVSIAGQGSRCKELEIFDETQFVQFRKNLSWNKYIKKEPLDDSMPVEQPSLIQQAMDMLTTAKVLSPRDLADDLCLPPSALQALTGMPQSAFLPTDSPAEVTLNIKRPPSQGSGGKHSERL